MVLDEIGDDDESLQECTRLAIKAHGAFMQHWDVVRGYEQELLAYHTAFAAWKTKISEISEEEIATKVALIRAQ